MNKQFTASEVRGQIAWLRNVTVVGTKTTYQMLDAFADLLEAQEGAVPVVTRESAINAIEHVGRYNGPGRETEARQMLVEGSPSAAHSAQAQPNIPDLTDEEWEILFHLYPELKARLQKVFDAHDAQAQPPAASVTDAMVNAAMRADFCGHSVADALMCGTDWNTEVMRAALEAALAAQENPNG